MKYMTVYSHILIAFCISLSVVILYHFLTTTAPTIVMANITQLTQEWIATLTAEPLSEKENADILAKKAKILESVLDETSEEYHWIILSSQNILAGAPDVTEFIKSKIAEKMEESE